MKTWYLVSILLLGSLALAANPPRVLIIYDMEGVSGINDPEMTFFSRPEKYAVGRKSLTADVNAAIRGLKAGGAGVILIQDGHGSGNNNEPDLLLAEMDPSATMDFHTVDFDPYSTGLDGSLDAIVCIGMHPRARTSGFMAHTINSNVAVRVNGVDFTETHIIAASAARWGIPVIMVAGDDTLGEQLKPDFPELEYVAGKVSKSLNSAEPLPRAEADRRIEAAARAAMQKFIAGKYRPYYLRPPFDFQLSWRNWEQAAGAKRSPLVRPDGDLGVRYTAPSFVEGYELGKHLLVMASDGAQILIRILNETPEGKKVLDQLQAATLARWLDPEHQPAVVTPPPRPAAPKRYWGDN
jgi:D-amino peptidase